MAGFTELPSLDPESLGATNQDLIPFGGEPHRTSSRLLGKIRQYLIDTGAALGLGDGSTPDSLTARVLALEEGGGGGGGGKSASKYIVGLATAGDTEADCTYLDTGNGAALWAACDAASAGGGTVLIRSPGVFDLTLPGAPTGYLYLVGVHLQGAGPGLTAINMRSAGKLMHFALVNSRLVDITLTAPVPTGLLTTSGEPPVYVYASNSELRNVALYGNGSDYSTADHYTNQIGLAALMVERSYTGPGDTFLKNVTVANFPYRAQYLNEYAALFPGILSLAAPGALSLHMDDACKVTQCEGGIILENLAAGSTLSGVIVEDPHVVGFHVGGSEPFTLEKCAVRSSVAAWSGPEGFDAYRLDAAGSTLADVRIDRCSAYLPTPAPGVRGITVDGDAFAVQVTGCTVLRAETGLSFTNTGSSAANSAHGNTFISCGTSLAIPDSVDVSGSHNVISGAGMG